MKQTIYLSKLVLDTGAERAQDARLRAAAPEMLKALEKANRNIIQLCQLVCWLANDPKKARADDFAEEVRAAIAKAKGEL